MSNVLREPDYLPENKVNNRITHICTGTSVGCLYTMTIIITIIALFYFILLCIYTVNLWNVHTNRMYINPQL